MTSRGLIKYVLSTVAILRLASAADNNNDKSETKHTMKNNDKHKICILTPFCVIDILDDTQLLSVNEDKAPVNVL